MMREDWLAVRLLSMNLWRTSRTKSEPRHREHMTSRAQILQPIGTGSFLDPSHCFQIWRTLINDLQKTVSINLLVSEKCNKSMQNHPFPVLIWCILLVATSSWNKKVSLGPAPCNSSAWCTPWATFKHGMPTALAYHLWIPHTPAIPIICIQYSMICYYMLLLYYICNFD